MSFFDKAIEIDPGFARAYTGLAFAESVAIDNGWTTSREGSLARHGEGGRTAVVLGSIQCPGTHRARHLLHVRQRVPKPRRAREGAEPQSERRRRPSYSAQASDIGSASQSWRRNLQIGPSASTPITRIGTAGDSSRVLLLRSNMTAPWPSRRASFMPDFWDYVFRPLLYAELGRTAETVSGVSELLKTQS